MSNLEQMPVTALHGVGARMAEKLARIGVVSVQDMLFHLPLRYVDRTRITPIGSLQVNTEVVIEGVIKGTDIVPGRRRSLMCKVQDHSGVATLRFFHFSQAQRDNLASGGRVRCFGELRYGRAGLEMYHPEYQFVDAAPPALAQTLTPIYPAGEGLTQQRLRKLAAQALEKLAAGELAELLPSTLCGQSALSLADALHLLHAPPSDVSLHLLAAGEHPAQQRLAFEELLAHHLSLQRMRQQIKKRAAPVLAVTTVLQERFFSQLTFALTQAQQRVSAEIAADLSRGTPMLRLLQGDVGSGKTVVAALAALQAIGAGYQVALMAPTEILSEQHLNNFETWFRPLNIKVVWLTGRSKGKARAAILDAIAGGQAQLVVGTHALFQADVVFHKPGLTIIDEQHRFGVHQRLALREKGAAGAMPHQLIMTATPIPRTLAMSAYADLDFSVIDELPPGRLPVNTVAIANERREAVVERIRAACGRGQQAYWVCTLIEESETLAAQAAEVTANELVLLLPEVRIGLVHGRLKPAEKAKVMAAFQDGDIELLVATTVIEVGVDVPNASLIIIENPERLGLAQLHQLRGRVGRGAVASHCVLLYGTPLSQRARDRIAIMRQTNDGFRIAEEDLRLRGPGEVLGTRQTGELSLRIADLERDAHLLERVKETAGALLREHPDNVERLVQRWLGGNERYSQA
ncbi:MAG TPA: ATP-dependent DNA helicase RecG [Porticoccaceae bacterium]|nr:ATP-dependent DNA helicase RecG [Porticoccaceae bacterium]